MKIFLLLIALCFNVLLPAQTLRSIYEYSLVWEDNFDSLNTDIWKVQNHFDHYGNERQVYTNRPENVFIDSGQLVLRVNRETYTCPPEALNPWGCSRQYNTGQPYEYTSGYIETKPEYNTQYGYIEARIFLPYGRGFWPAFWTFVGEGLPSHENAAEIDIFEMYGDKPPYILNTDVHMFYCNENYPTYPECNDIPTYGREHIIESYAFKYHIYSIEWTPEFIKWKMNDQSLRVMDNPGVVDPIRLIINMAILQGNPPNPGTIFPADIKIDYLRVYSIDETTGTNSSSLLNNEGVSIYPNPTHENFVLIKSENDQIINQIRILNSIGQVISVVAVNSLEYKFDVSNFTKGNYFIQITNNEGFLTKSLIKL